MPRHNGRSGRPAGLRELRLAGQPLRPTTAAWRRAPPGPEGRVAAGRPSPQLAPPRRVTRRGRSGVREPDRPSAAAGSDVGRVSPWKPPPTWCLRFGGLDQHPPGCTRISVCPCRDFLDGIGRQDRPRKQEPFLFPLRPKIDRSPMSRPLFTVTSDSTLTVASRGVSSLPLANLCRRPTARWRCSSGWGGPSWAACDSGRPRTSLRSLPRSCVRPGNMCPPSPAACVKRQWPWRHVATPPRRDASGGAAPLPWRSNP